MPQQLAALRERGLHHGLEARKLHRSQAPASGTMRTTAESTCGGGSNDEGGTSMMASMS